MKIYKLKIPVSFISLEDKEKNYFNWRWIFFDETVSNFVQEIKNSLNLSFNDYWENRDDEEYRFGFDKNSIEYFIFFTWNQDIDEFVEFEVKFDAFAVKNYLLFKRKIRSEQHYEKLKESILKFIKINNFEISGVEK